MLIWLTIQLTQSLFGIKVDVMSSGLIIGAGLELFMEIAALLVLTFAIVYERLHKW